MRSALGDAASPLKAHVALPSSTESVRGASGRRVVRIPVVLAAEVRAERVQGQDEDVADERAVFHSDELLRLDTVLDEQVSEHSVGERSGTSDVELGSEGYLE